MIKSISAWAFDPKRPAREIFALAKSLGFEGVEASMGEAGSSLSYQVTATTTPAAAAQLRADAAAEGIQLVSLASGFGWSNPITSGNFSVRARGLQAVRDQIIQANQLGLDAILVVPGGVGADFIPGFAVTPYAEAYDNALAGLKELAPFAEDNGVTIGVENVWNKFLLSPLEFRDFLDQVGSTRVRSYFDVGNVVVMGYPEDWVATLGPRIARVHFKDFKRSVGTLEGFCPLGEGDSDYPAVIAALKSCGYAGPVTAEYFNCEADLPAISSAMDAILAN